MILATDWARSRDGLRRTRNGERKKDKANMLMTALIITSGENDRGNAADSISGSSSKGRSRIHKLRYRSYRDTNEVKTARPLVVKPIDGVLRYINRAPDSYNPGGHPLNYGIGNELGKLGRSNRRAFNDNGWGTFGVIRLSFEIPSEWLEEGVDTNSIPDNFQKSQP